MTIKEYGEIEEKFKKDTIGKFIDYDGICGAQCWDLVQLYAVKYLGVPENALGGCNYIRNLLYPPKLNEMLKYFDEVPMDHMLKGDIVVWYSDHIAIFDSFDGVNCFYLTQNDGTGKNPSGCTRLGILYLGDAKAFRLKGVVEDPTPTPEPIPTPEPTKYVVQEGDTLWDICVRFYGDGTKYAEVATKNGIVNPDLIYPGQVIKLW